MKVVLLISLFMSTNILAKKELNSAQRAQDAIFKLILDEEKAILRTKRRSNSLKYRYFELQQEKLKHFSKKENLIFLKQKNPNRDGVFKKTKKQYFYLKELAFEIKKSKGAYKYIAPTFLALSLSARDFKFENKELSYLKIAKAYAKNNSPVMYAIKIALAEYYYNAKEYRKSNKLYERLVRNKKDQWHTKNMYNYAWTQFKTHQFDRAIVNLEKAYRRSAKKEYIDFQEQIMNSLIIFYITHQKTDRAIKFIKEYGKDRYNSYLKLAKKASQKGFYADSNKVIALIYAEKLSIEQDIELKVFELSHYRHFNKKNLFFKTAKKLSKHKIKKEETEEITNLITEEVRDLQQLLKKDFDLQTGRYQVAALKYSLFYFKELRKYDSKNKIQYFFYAAETLFSVKEYKRSVPYYKKTLNIKDPFALNQKVIDALYIAIEDAGYSKPVYERQLEYIYTKVIYLWPKKSTTIAIYNKLFFLYHKQKRHKKMTRTLTRFIKSFPHELASQRKLYELQIDLYIAQKNTTVLSSITKKLRRNDLGFSKDKVLKIEDILANLLFNTFKKERAKGNDDKALMGYQSVYANSNYPKKIQAQAAFNAAIIYVDLHDSNNSLKWIKRTRKNHKKIYRDHISDVKNLANRTLLFQDFNGASSLYAFYLRTNCSKKKQNKGVLNNLVNVNIAKDYARRSIYFYKKFQSCVSNEEAESTKNEILTHLYESNNATKLYSFSLKTNSDKKLLFSRLENLYWKNKQNSSIKKYISALNIHESKHFMSSLNEYAQFNQKSIHFSKENILFTEKMTPEVFSKKLSDYLGKMGSIIQLSDNVLKKENAQLNVMTLKNIDLSLKTAVQKIEAVKSPIKDKNFLKQFNSQMKSLVKDIRSQIHSYTNMLERFRFDYKVLSNTNRKATRTPASAKTIDLD